MTQTLEERIKEVSNLINDLKIANTPPQDVTVYSVIRLVEKHYKLIRDMQARIKELNIEKQELIELYEKRIYNKTLI